MSTLRVRPERTGWRDEGISTRHRRWGWDCPMIDIDFLALEYDKGKASALVEFKHEAAEPQYRTHPSYQALIDLGDRARVPVFGVRYADDYSWYRVTPLNDIARGFLANQETMTEVNWMRLLYKLRGRELPDSILESWEEAL